jgi:2-keto-4-pentenoate hydratase/2-oxohepta-3-ene-1,7-dioic acid hydratase in catechol pathway
VSKELVGDASNLVLQTRINGELRQDSTTSDLLFGVKKLIAFISQGTTLRKGTLVMTGTPSGKQKHPPLCHSSSNEAL